MSAINKSAVFAVFNDADKLSASFADRLLSLGLADKAMAKPFALEWAGKKYGEDVTDGKLPRNSAAERAMYRVLGVCFPSADQPTAQKSGNANPSKVEKLLAAYLKLDGAQKRSFKAQLAKL